MCVCVKFVKLIESWLGIDERRKETVRHVNFSIINLALAQRGKIIYAVI